MRRTTYILWTLALLIIRADVSSAQNFWQPTKGPYGGDIRSIAVDSPNNLVFAATWGGGIFRSTDNGASWLAINIGLGENVVFSLAVNAIGTVFAGTTGHGLYRSTDHGDTWRASNSGLLDLEVRAIAISSSYIYVCLLYTSPSPRDS